MNCIASSKRLKSQRFHANWINNTSQTVKFSAKLKTCPIQQPGLCSVPWVLYKTANSRNVTRDGLYVYHYHVLHSRWQLLNSSVCKLTRKFRWRRRQKNANEPLPRSRIAPASWYRARRQVDKYIREKKTISYERTRQQKGSENLTGRPHTWHWQTSCTDQRFTGVSMRQVRSTTDTSAVGTRKAIPVSFPLRLGITLPTALAAPVADGMMLMPAVRPPRQSLLLGPSTVFCVAVYEWTVVIRPSMMLYFSWMTLASGDRQLVVHDALLASTHHRQNIPRW